MAAILIGAQLITGLFAAGLTAWFASDQQRELAATALTSRMDAVAEEIERRAAPLDTGLNDLPDRLIEDLAWRFPDPIALLAPDGSLLHVVQPASDSAVVRSPLIPPALVPGSDASIDAVIVDAGDDVAAGGFAYAPLYDAAGFPVGGLLVQPVRASLDRELEGTRAAVRQARIVIAVVSVIVALGLGAVLTWLLVRPLRSMSARIGQIADGRYDTRIDVASNDEFGRLAEAINDMAGRVQQSIESIQASDRLRRELVANVGHDIRTPLAVLSGSVEEAERALREGKEDRARSLLETATRQTDVLARLVDDLFELAVLEQDKPPLRIEPVLPAELLADAADRHRELFRRAQIEFTAEASGNPGLLDADGARLLRVLDNLLSNARRHTPAGGRVELRVGPEGGDVVFEVADTGSGIPEDELGHVFERYYRGSEARTRSASDGSGLGLAIARAIVVAHGGTITAARRTGGGTRMTLRLPRTVEERE
ncbi:MAG: HAMP domain-containing histidine kinase [Rhodothermales bacterium]|nr:HAMP domain-containing histidine kinase [Rhodothermales bacterium]